MGEREPEKSGLQRTEPQKSSLKILQRSLDDPYMFNVQLGRVASGAMSSDEHDQED